MSSVKPIVDTLLSEVRTLVISARNAAARTINTLQVLTNYMRRFYLVYKARLPVISEKPSRKSTEEEKAPLNLSWSHYVFLCRINNEKERSFYEIEG